MSTDTTSVFDLLDISKHIPYCPDGLIAKITSVTESLESIVRDLSDIAFLIAYGKGEDA